MPHIFNLNPNIVWLVRVLVIIIVFVAAVAVVFCAAQLHVSERDLLPCATWEQAHHWVTCGAGIS